MKWDSRRKNVVWSYIFVLTPKRCCGKTDPVRLRDENEKESCHNKFWLEVGLRKKERINDSIFWDREWYCSDCDREMKFDRIKSLAQIVSKEEHNIRYGIPSSANKAFLANPYSQAGGNVANYGNYGLSANNAISSTINTSGSASLPIATISWINNNGTNTP
jgi:hypothetical protein